MRGRFYFILLTLAWWVLPATSVPTLVQPLSRPPAATSGGVYLNPTTGRFWTADSFEGRQSDPLSLHKYLYCHDDPVNGIDPSGRKIVFSGEPIDKKDYEDAIKYLSEGSSKAKEIIDALKAHKTVFTVQAQVISPDQYEWKTHLIM